jgi:hypothetical protein
VKVKTSDTERLEHVSTTSAEQKLIKSYFCHSRTGLSRKSQTCVDKPLNNITFNTVTALIGVFILVEATWTCALTAQILCDNLSMDTFVVDTTVIIVIPGRWGDLQKGKIFVTLVILQTWFVTP